MSFDTTSDIAAEGLKVPSCYPKPHILKSLSVLRALIQTLWWLRSFERHAKETSQLVLRLRSKYILCVQRWYF